MKRLLGIFRGSAVILSLLLFLITLILWPRSYYVAEGINYNRDGYDAGGLLIRRASSIASGHGHLQVGIGQISSIMFRSLDKRHDPGLHFYRDKPSDWGLHRNQSTVWSFLGFYYHDFRNVAVNSRILLIPDWAILLLTSVLPASWLLQRRRRRRPANLCSTCGYDLRATPDRCPECGTAPAGTIPS